MIKERFDVIASSLGSYFGVGFNTPEQQLSYDLGLDEAVFTKDAEDRMSLGTELEDAVLNYFEKKLGIEIKERNDAIRWAFDNKLKCKVDGMTILDGTPTGVECKVSNAESKKFTEDKGYYLQCQAYMAATGLDQWVLLGLWQGKPVHRIIKRDDRVINLIGELVNYLFDVFNGIADPNDYPYDIIREYTGAPEIEEADFTDDDKSLLEELYSLKQKSKEDSDRIAELETYFKETFKNVKYSGSEFIATISVSKRSGGIDIDRIKDDYPLLDEEKYRKPDSEYTQLRFSRSKK